MYTVRIEGTFSSAHNLRHYRGKCEELHGHNWKVEVTAAQKDLDTTGMVMDFTDMKRALHEVIDELDHTYLNKIAYFKKVNPTSENMACYIYRRLKGRIPALASVTVWENTASSAAYQE